MITQNWFLSHEYKLLRMKQHVHNLQLELCYSKWLVHMQTATMTFLNDSNGTVNAGSLANGRQAQLASVRRSSPRRSHLLQRSAAQEPSASSSAQQVRKRRNASRSLRVSVVPLHQMAFWSTACVR